MSKNKRRIEGWKITKRSIKRDKTGVALERIERVRTAGILKKLSHAFFDELSKIANGDEDETKGSTPSEEAVLAFIKKNPRPTDKQLHSWAESSGHNVHKAEQIVYKILSDLMHKGRSKGKHPGGIARDDVSRGVKIEEEHTPNRIIQRKITDDHNTELKKYYDQKMGLPKMEKVLESRK